MTDIRTERERARVLLSMRRYDEAARVLAAVVAAEPDSSHAWCMLAQAELAVRLEPHNWVGHLSVAQAAVGAADYVGERGVSRLTVAERAVGAARELAPEEPEVHYLAGQVSREAGDSDAAVEHFRRTLASDPAHAGAMNELGRISLERGHTGQAAEHFIQASRTAPGEAVYGRNVAVAVARMEASSHRLVGWVIYGSWLLAVLAMFGGLGNALNWEVTLTALVIAAMVVAAIVWIQLRRLPKQARRRAHLLNSHA